MSTQSSSGGISVVGLLGVVFVVLKLTHVIDWSWWWVTCPFWIGVVLVLIVVVVVFIGSFIKVVRSERNKPPRFSPPHISIIDNRKV